MRLKTLNFLYLLTTIILNLNQDDITTKWIHIIGHDFIGANINHESSSRK